MIAYNETWLYNKYLQNQAGEAVHEQCITADEYDAICKAKEVKFYTPNYFVRIGLAALTLVICSFSLGLIALISNFKSPEALFIFPGIVCYVIAELMIKNKAHYNSGVDNMLVWMAAIFFCFGFMVSKFISDSNVMLSLVALVVCMALALRFADRLLSTAAAMALLCFVFFCNQRMGGAAKPASPFILMVVLGALYYFSARAMKMRSLLLYRGCLECVNIVALVAFYASCNYYVVSEVGNSTDNAGYKPDVALPLGWFFWIWTFLVPVIYITLGIRKRNVTVIRTGVILVAAAIMTYRYYRSIMAPETAMMLAGTILFIVSYSLINYLKEPRNGFTFKPETYVTDTPDISKVLTKEFVDKAGASEVPTGKQGNSDWG